MDRIDLMLGVNPFITEIKTKKVIGRKIQDTDYKLVDGKGKETGKTIVLAEEEEYDKAEYIKLFDGIEFLTKLTKGGLKLAAFIFKTVDFDNDIIILNPDILAEKGVINSRRAVYDAISDLIENKVIAKTNTTGIYYINVSLFFKGQRRFLNMKKDRHI